MKLLSYIMLVGLASIAISFGQTATTEQNVTVQPRKNKIERVEKTQNDQVRERGNVTVEQRKNETQIQQERPNVSQEQSRVTTEKHRTHVTITEPRFRHFFENGRYRFKFEHHDRTWWHTHYTRVMLIEGCWYFYEGGFWFPAYGYDPNCVYSTDDPIQD